jgi:demethylmenaquinone methyltransferase/2-methoxy-6-polyprenyl-1,4-benzoquinol methylase
MTTREIKPVVAAPPQGHDRHSGLDTALRFFEGTASSYDLTVHLCTLGLDWWWKRKLLEELPHAPRLILDQACGTGILTLAMARKYPSCRVIGIDLHQDYVHLAVRKAEQRAIENTVFMHGRAEDVVLKGPFDCITSSYLAKYADLHRLVLGAQAMLREGGTLIMHDFTYPRTKVLALLLKLYFKLMRILGSRFFPQWQPVFQELEPFLKASRWVEELLSCLWSHSLTPLGVKQHTLGLSTIVIAQKPH